MQTKCPHCSTSIYLWTDSCAMSTEQELHGDPIVSLEVGFCPSCHKPIINMEYGKINGFYPDGTHSIDVEYCEPIYPTLFFVEPLDEAIPTRYANEYYEAAKILSISPKSSATLSRYLLQLILHEELNIKKRNLEEEICELESQEIASATLVSMLQVFRKIANFGAHPKKSSNSGEIVEIEAGEAEIILDILKELFECIFVKPAKKKQFLSQVKEKYGIDV